MKHKMREEDSVVDHICHSELMPGATTCVKNFVNVTNADKVLIITDKPPIAEALAKASEDAGGEALIIYLPPSRAPIKQLSGTLKSVILESTVVFTPFDPKEGEINFLIEILGLADSGVKRKIAHMPDATEDMFIHGMLSLSTDEIKNMTELTEMLARLLSATTKIRIQSTAHKETDLWLNLDGWSRSGIVSTGHIIKGSWGNLPSGEAFIVPKRGEAKGYIVVDKAILEYSPTEVPVAMNVSRGMIELDSIENEKALKKDLIKLREKYGDGVKTICEFGIGTNPKFYTLKPVEIEKILGTVHIAIGANTKFGGDIEVPRHTDMVISEPTVTVYDLQSNPVTIIEGGKIKKDRIDSFFKVNYNSFTEQRTTSDIIRIKEGFRVEKVEENELSKVRKYIYNKFLKKGMQERKANSRTAPPTFWVKDKEDMLHRCWSDYRGHELCIAVGDETTAKEVKKVWDFIDPTKSKRLNKVGKILIKFREEFGGDDMLVYQLLNTLEKFGIIEIEPEGEVPQA